MLQTKSLNQNSFNNSRQCPVFHILTWYIIVFKLFQVLQLNIKTIKCRAKLLANCVLLQRRSKVKKQKQPKNYELTLGKVRRYMQHYRKLGCVTGQENEINMIKICNPLWTCFFLAFKGENAYVMSFYNFFLFNLAALNCQ